MWFHHKQKNIELVIFKGYSEAFMFLLADCQTDVLDKALTFETLRKDSDKPFNVIVSTFKLININTAENTSLLSVSNVTKFASAFFKLMNALHSHKKARYLYL